MNQEWKGKWALVTGGSSGIGVALARQLAAGGTYLVLTARRRERLEELARALQQSHGIRTEVFTADLARPEAPQEIYDFTKQKGIEIDLLINNAGLALGTAPAQNASLDQWNQMIETNITGLVTLTYKLLSTLIARKGAIINISSVAASYPYPGGNVYGGTKAFVSQFSLGLRSDLHGTGVRVTSVEPA